MLNYVVEAYGFCRGILTIRYTEIALKNWQDLLGISWDGIPWYQAMRQLLRWSLFIVFSRIFILYNCQKSTWSRYYPLTWLHVHMTDSIDRLDWSRLCRSTRLGWKSIDSIDRLDRFQGLYKPDILFIYLQFLLFAKKNMRWVVCVRATWVRSVYVHFGTDHFSTKNYM